MRDTLPSPLPPSLAALLDAERERPALSDAAQQRILTRLEATVNWPPPRRGWLTALGTFAGGLLVGAALCGVLLSGRLGARQPKLLVLDSPPPPPPVVVVVHAAAPPTLVQPPAAESLAHRPGARAERSQRNPPALPDHEHDTELARERALIETARTALARKQTDVVELLFRHAQQFPQGRLSEERESLLVQALLQSGRVAEARSRGERFRAHWPNSLLLPVINAALQAIP